MAQIPPSRPPGSNRMIALLGAAGLVPFWAPLSLAAASKPYAVWALTLQAVYGGLVLSFLGGARFGRVVGTEGRGWVAALAVVPTIYALGVLAAPSTPGLGHALIAAGIAGTWAWDVFASDLPRPYRVLRTTLSALAVVALAIGAVMLRGLR
jgi:hypothetical protein